ncbi:MAG: FtsX-like permease family protein [Motiliproteus sp.]
MGLRLLPPLLLQANLGYFRKHPWLLMFALLGIMLGVAGVSGVEITNYSARKNFDIANEQLLGQARYRLSSEQPIAESLLTQLREHWGVEAAPLISRHVRLHNDTGPVVQLLGIDVFQLQRFGPMQEVPVSDGFQPRQLLLEPASVLIGEISYQRQQLKGAELTLFTDRGDRPVNIIGRIGAADDSRFSSLLLMDIGRAQQLFNMAGKIDHIELNIDDDKAQKIRQWVPAGIQLVSVQKSRGATENLTEALHLNLSAMGLLAMVVGVFLVYNTLFFSLVQRQQLFGQLRNVGVSQRELITYLLLELLLIGSIGTLLGLLAGLLLADQLLVLVTRTINDLYAVSPIEILQLQPWLILKVVAVGLGGALLAGLMPALHAVKTSVRSSQSRVLLERKSRQLSQRLPGLSVLLLLLALVLYYLPQTGIVGGYLLVTALLLAGACLMPMLVSYSCRGLAAIRSPQRGLVFSMALKDTERGLSRTAVALMALMVAVAVTVSMSLMIGSFRSTLDLWLKQRLNADIYISPQTRLPDDYRSLAPQIWQWLQDQPEIETLASYQRVSTETLGRQLQLFASDLPPQAQSGYRFKSRFKHRFKSTDVQQVWQDFQQPGHILISEPLANRHGLFRGDKIPLMTPLGVEEFVIAGVYFDYGDSNGRAILSPQNFSRYWHLKPGRVAGLYLKPEADIQSLLNRIRRLPEADMLRISERRGVLDRSLEIFERTFLVTDVLRLLALLVAFVGMLSALMALQLERQQEMKLLRAVGLSLKQRVLLLSYQGLLIGLLAGIAAVPVGMLLAWGLIEVIQLRAFGWTLFYELEWQSLLQAPILAVTAALLACVYPAWKQYKEHSSVPDQILKSPPSGRLQ